MAKDVTQRRRAAIPSGEARFRFAGFVLDVERLELRKGAQRIEVQPKVFHLLRYLLENAERTVTKDELLDALWPDTTVSEGSLTSAVSLARHALGERQRESQIVRTVQRLGYRMGVPVTREMLHERRKATAVRPASSDRPAILVLPFSNLSGDPGQEYLVDGITEDLTTALSGVPDLTVMSRNPAFLYKGKAVSPQQLHEECGVRYVVEGSIRRVMERIRINVQLIDAASAGHVWADKYDRELADIFGLQSEIVKTMLGRLRIELLDHQIAGLRKEPTSSLSAYECYLRGRALLHQNTPDSVRRARELLEFAVALDPDYANAHAQLASVELQLWMLLRDAKSERLERAERSVLRALELDEFSATPQGNLAVLRWVQGRFAEALRAALEAVRLLPIDSFLITLGMIQKSLGQWQAAQDSIDATLRVNPHNSMGGVIWNAQAVLHHVHGRSEVAKTYWERAREANPAFVSPRLWLAYQHVTECQQERAEQVAREVLEALPEMTADQALDFLNLDGHQPEAADQMIAKFRQAGLP